MTAVDPEEVVFYDIDLDASPEDLYANPETRWFGVKAMARQAITAGVDWDPLLHPRGRDGKFIDVLGFVRWFNFKTGKWTKGQVTEIDTQGNLTVQSKSPSPVGEITHTTMFSHEGAAEKLFAAATVKANVHLPSNLNETSLGWKKTGGQGGSNPGGFFTYTEDNDTITPSQWQAIIIENGLSLDQEPTNDEPYIFRTADGKMYFRRFDPQGSDFKIYDINGDPVPDDVGIDVGGAVYYVGTGSQVEEAWDAVRKSHKEFGMGTDFYVKKSKSPSHASNEILANRLYELAGVPVAETLQGHDGQTIASKLVPSTDSKINVGAALDDPEVMAKVREDMVVDAWLANWDVVGLGLENVQIVDGVPYRIDAGGALIYRAQGGPKGNKFGPEVGEISTLRNKSMNAQAAKVFGDITDDELALGAFKVASVNPEAIIDLVEALEMEPDVADILIARRQNIIDKFELDDPWHVDPVKDADTPKILTPESIKAMEDAQIDALLQQSDAADVDGKKVLRNEDGESFTLGKPSQPLYFKSDYDTELLPDAEITDVGDEYITVSFSGKTSGGGEGNFSSKYLPNNLTYKAPEKEIDDVPEVPDEVSGKGKLDWNGKVWDISLGEWTEGSLNKTSVQFYEELNDPETVDGFQAIPATDVGVGDHVFYENQIWKVYDAQGTNLMMNRTLGINSDDVSVDFGNEMVYVAPTEGYGQAAAAQHRASLEAAITEDVGDPQKIHTQITKSDILGYNLGTFEFFPAHVGAGTLPTDLFQASPGIEGIYVGHNPQIYKPGDLIYVGWRKEVFEVADPPSNSYGALRVVRPDGKKMPLRGPAEGAEDENIYAPNNDFGKVYFKAINDAQKISNGVETGPSTPVDSDYIDQLNKKQDINGKVDAAVPDPPAVAPDDEQILLNVEIYEALTDGTMGVDADAMGGTFLDVFGSGGSMTVGDFKNWVENVYTPDAGAEVPQDFDYEALGAKIAHNAIFGDDIQLPEGKSQSTLPTTWEGINPKLLVEKKINFGNHGADSVNVAQNMVGKTFFVQYSDEEKWDSSVGDSSWVMGAKVKTGLFGLMYIEGFDASTNRLTGRTATGKVTYLPVMSNKGSGFSPDMQPNDQYDFYDVNESVPVDSLKAMTGPTMKKNGEIVVNGQVVGEWEVQNSGWMSYGSSSGPWVYKIYPPFTPSGQEVTGLAKKKGNLKHYTSLNIVPPPAAVTKKKSASKGHQAVKKMVSADIPGDPTLSDGSEAKLGDWVKSTKGGGGFIGKIVGWPNQDTHPGLAFAVDTSGVQKIVKLKTQKKMDGPGEQDSPAEIIDVPGGTIPSAYADIKLADGKIPVVGQRVKAGNPGSEIEGIITNINPEQGWVYILTDDGKKKSKTFSVTSVINEPTLIWSNEAAGAKLASTKPTAKSGPKKKGGPGYPAPDGSVIDQPESMKNEWLEGNPKRKLTKDGYAPKVGMRIRLKDGTEATIVKTSDQWAANPNGLRIWVPSEGKVKSASTSTVEVDHANELYGYGGKKPKKIAGLTNYMGSQTFPDGTEIYSVDISVSYYSYTQKKSRTTPTQVFIAAKPDGTHSFFKPNYDGGLYSYNGDLGKVLQGKYYGTEQATGNVQKIGVMDSEGGSHLKLTPYSVKSGYNSDDPSFTHAEIEWFDDGVPVDADDAPDVPNSAPADTTPDVPETPEPETPTANAPEAPEIPDTEEPTVEVEPEPQAPQAILQDPESVDMETLPVTGEMASPQLISSGITPLTPPSPPVPMEPGAADPPIPKATGNRPDFNEKPEVLKGTRVKSLQEALFEMVDKKDSDGPGTGSYYALGDSDLVEDMQFRYNVEVVNGQERMVMRLRLREDMSEEQLAKMITVQGGKKGNWKTQGTKYPIDFKVGDAIAVRVGSNNQKSGEKMLKPVAAGEATGPNARVIEDPILIGKSPGPNGEGEYQTYRLKVKTEAGDIGEVDIQYRPGGSVTNFEWDPEAPAPTTGSQLSLTPTAQDAGWTKLGAMSVPGSIGSDNTDSTGKFKDSGSTIGNMATGSGGHRLQRIEGDGTKITFNSAHDTEGGTGNETTRRANISGEVRISVPIDGRSEEEMVDAYSRSLELVGIEPEAQRPPSNDQIVKFAMAKLVATYHPTFNYRGKAVTGTDDPRVGETLAHMSKELKTHLKRDVTLDDVRIHTHASGRMQVLMSPEVGKAIAKRQKINQQEHHGVSGVSMTAGIFGGPHSGLMATDERWSLGVNTTGLSSHTDMRIGSGDRVYMRGRNGTPSSRNVVLNAAMVAMGLEQYNNMNNNGDSFGRRGSNNTFMTSGTGRETMYKRGFDPEMLTMYAASSDSEAEQIIAALKARGVTHIGGRPIEEIILGPTAANIKVGSDDWYDTGMDIFANDIPITQLIAEVTEGIAAGATVTLTSIYDSEGKLLGTVNLEDPMTGDTE